MLKFLVKALAVLAIAVMIMFVAFDLRDMFTHCDRALETVKLVHVLNSMNASTAPNGEKPSSPPSYQQSTTDAQLRMDPLYQTLRKGIAPREPRIESLVFDASILCFVFSALLWLKMPGSPRIKQLFLAGVAGIVLSAICWFFWGPPIQLMYG
jgi:hypothetical protein